MFSTCCCSRFIYCCCFLMKNMEAMFVVRKQWGELVGIWCTYTHTRTHAHTHTHTHTQTCTDRANVCIQLPMAACIKFQILVLAHKTVKGSVAPSLQASIQQYMPASVLCSATTDLFALLSLCSAGQPSTRYQLFSLLALKLCDDLPNSFRIADSRHLPQQGENCFQEYLVPLSK